MAQAQQSLTVRPARAADGPAIDRLLRNGLHTHSHPDWRSPIHWIGRAPAFVAENRYGLAGCLITSADSPPAAWVRAAAATTGGPPAVVVNKLLSAGLDALAALDISSLTAMPTAAWLVPVLDHLGFTIVEHVETWVKDDLTAPKAGADDIQVRPAQVAEMAHLAVIEQAAFPPRWQHSAETLALAWSQAATFTVAEQNGKITGFQFSQSHGDRAHLVRLTIDPIVQGTGVGTRLLADGLSHCAALGLTHISLNTQSNNLASHRLYAAFGFYRSGHPLPVWERQV
jgi:ribosomal protein S18 acetylase RimI-like enzyme